LSAGATKKSSDRVQRYGVCFGVGATRFAEPGKTIIIVDPHQLSRIPATAQHLISHSSIVKTSHSRQTRTPRRCVVSQYDVCKLNRQPDAAQRHVCGRSHPTLTPDRVERGPWGTVTKAAVLRPPSFPIHLLTSSTTSRRKTCSAWKSCGMGAPSGRLNSSRPSPASPAFLTSLSICSRRPNPSKERGGSWETDIR